MEYVPSRTLRDVLNERGRLPVDEALAVIDPVLQALAAAHADSVVHRDVKPENVLIGDDGHVYVTDFGLARATNSASTQHITSGLLLGTVAYLSPEQVKPGVSDERSDVYSAGIVLFEMLTGSPPFTGTEAISVAYRHVNEDVPRPSQSSVRRQRRCSTTSCWRHPPRPEPATGGRRRAAAAGPRGPAAGDARRPAADDGGPDPGRRRGRPARHRRDREPRVADRPTAVVAHPQRPPAADDRRDPPASGQALDPVAHRKRSRRRGLVALAVVLLLAVAAGAFAWWLGDGRNATVPRVTGLTAAGRQAQLESEGLEVEFARRAVQRDRQGGRGHQQRP